jgi:hypothetical protein
VAGFMEIRCDWTDRYPIDSCPTRVLTENGERMDRSGCIQNEINKKYIKKPLTEEQKQKYREDRRKKRKHTPKITRAFTEEQREKNRIRERNRRMAAKNVPT